MKKESVDGIREIVTNEGMSYTILYYLNSMQIEDKHLSELWEKAYLSLKKIEDYLQEDNKHQEQRS